MISTLGSQVLACRHWASGNDLGGLRVNDPPGLGQIRQLAGSSLEGAQDWALLLQLDLLAGDGLVDGLGVRGDAPNRVRARWSVLELRQGLDGLGHINGRY